MKCAVIMPSYNTERFITEAINSILAQTYKRCHLYIVDSSDTKDSECRILNKCIDAGADISVAVFPKAKLNPAQAKNDSLHSIYDDIDIDYIAFQDSDDISHPDRIAKQIAFMESNNLDWCGCQIQAFDRQNWKYIIQPKDKAELLFSQNCPLVPGATLIYKNNPEFQIFFNENLTIGEDVDFQKRLYEISNNYDCLPEILYAYRKHGNQLTYHNQSENYKQYPRPFQEV